MVNVTKKYGNIIVIDNLNLHVEDGEYFTLVGPTGHGKTTTLLIITGLVKPDEGEVYINGELVNNVLPEDRGVGFVFETFSLFPHYNVWKNVTYGPRVKAEDPKVIGKVANELLDMVLLSERSDAYPRELSGGMKQRVALARALGAGSKLLLLDEPFGSLDAKIRMALRREVRSLVKDRGLTVIHVTNDTDEAMMVSDKIGVLRKGHIMQADEPGEIYRHPKSIFVANFLGETNFLEGVVKKVMEKHSIVEIKARYDVQMLSTDWKREERIVLAVRTEYVTLEAGQVERVNAFPGYVERSQFIHGFIRYEVKLDTEDSMIAWAPAVLKNPFKIGARVTLSFEPEKISVYPYPKEGLKEALSLE